MRYQSTLLLTAAMSTQAAAATEAKEPAAPVIYVEYSAPDHCPTETDLFHAIEERAPAFRVVPGQQQGERLVVEIRNTGQGHMGSVRRVRDRHTRGAKYLRADRCDELVRALVFVAAVSLTRTEIAAEASGPDASLLVRPQAEPTSSRGVAWMLGVGFHAGGHLPPAPTSGVSLFVEGGSPAPSHEGAPKTFVWTPTARLSLSHVRNDFLRTPERASFRLTAAGLDLCPGSVRMTGNTRFGLCGTCEVGRLVGTGRTVDLPVTDDSWWSAAGLLARLRFSSDALALDVTGGFKAPFVRTRYFVAEPERTVAREPALIWVLGLSAGVKIP